MSKRNQRLSGRERAKLRRRDPEGYGYVATDIVWVRVDELHMSAFATVRPVYPAKRNRKM